MHTLRLLRLPMALALAAGITGCAMFNRGTMQYTRTTTIGKELMDLKDAKDKGAISEEEYNKVKKDLLSGGPMKTDDACRRCPHH